MHGHIVLTVLLAICLKKRPFNIRLGSCVYLGPTRSKFCPVSGLPSLVQNELAIGPDLTMASLQQGLWPASYFRTLPICPQIIVSYGQGIDCLAESVFSLELLYIAAFVLINSFADLHSAIMILACSNLRIAPVNSV